MSDTIRFLCAGLVVFITFTLEGISGFGSTVLALPFIIMLLGIGQAVPLLALLGWILALFIVIRSRKTICFKEFRFIAAHVAIGVPVGLFMASALPEKPLLGLLAAVMITVGIRGLLIQFRTASPAPSPSPKSPRTLWMRLVLFCGGIVHGAFSSGGPLVIIYAARALPDKSLFRVTLSMLWLTVNSITLTVWTLRGNVWTPTVGKSLLWVLPFITAGMILGDYLHHKVNQKAFRILVYSVLCASAVVLLCCRVI